MIGWKKAFKLARRKNTDDSSRVKEIFNNGSDQSK
jgi:hypothetical protein